MKSAKLLVMISVLVLTTNAFAVYTPHIWHLDLDEYDGRILYCKSAPSSPNNTPLHESWNLVDEYIDGSPNPHYLIGVEGYGHPGYFNQMRFYGDQPVLHIDAGAKVGFYYNIWASDGGSPYEGHGTVNVEGTLIVNRLSSWKGGTTMETNVWGDGYLDLNEYRLGNSDAGYSIGWCNLMGGTVITDKLVFYPDGYIDITGGEFLIKNSDWSVAEVEAAIAAGDIFNSNADEGYVIDVTTVDVDGTLYTSITLKFDPLLRSIYLLGQAIDTKDSANEVLDEALAMEMTAKGLLDEVLMGLDPEDPNYEDVETAKAMTQVAIVGERACQRKVDKTAKKLENALGLLGAGDGSNPPKPPKP